MIGVIVKNPMSANFARLGKYILHAGNMMTDDGKKLASLDMSESHTKVEWYRITNCISSNPGVAIREIEITQNKNTRAKSDKTMHVVLSWPDGERPTDEQIKDMEDAAIDKLGLSGHQRISALHNDTDNWHLHIAINKIHPTAYRIIDPYYGIKKLQEVCVDMEKKHGLEINNHDFATDKNFIGNRIEIRQWVRDNALEDLEKASSWGELNEIARKHGIQFSAYGRRLFVERIDKSQRCPSRSVNVNLSCNALSEKFGGPMTSSTIDLERRLAKIRERRKVTVATTRGLELHTYLQESYKNEREVLDALREERSGRYDRR